MLLEAQNIPPVRLLWLLVPLFLAWRCMRRQEVGLEGRLALGVLRAAVQLSALGFVLVPLFAGGAQPWILLVLGSMCALAAFFSLGLLGKRPGLALWPQALCAILPVVLGFSLFAVAFIIPLSSLFEPRYLVSIAGMLAGISMNGVALAGERFQSGLKQRKGEIELRLLLGARGLEAIRPLLGESVRVSLTPTLNSLVAVGLVSIPGTLSGQVMTGGDPLVAARYQLMIMVLWVCASVLAPTIFLHLISRRLAADHCLHQVPLAAHRPVFLEPQRRDQGSCVAGSLALDARPPQVAEGGVFTLDEEDPDSG